MTAPDARRPGADAAKEGAVEGRAPQAPAPHAPAGKSRAAKAAAAKARAEAMKTLGARLRTAPHRFDGLQAMRLTELGLGRLGTATTPADEPARVVAVQGLAFAASAVASVADEGGRVRVKQAFLGLTGPLGVLPQPYSELVQRADRLRNRAVSAFLDLFNHRLASLFVRASEKYRLGLLLQRSATQPQPLRGEPSRGEPSRGELSRGEPARGETSRGEAGHAARDPASQAMQALAGFGTPFLQNRMAVEDEVVLFYAGLFAARLRPPGALQAMLADYLRMPVRIAPYSGRWVPVDAAEQSRLSAQGGFCRLGVDAVAGARIWDVQSNFRVVVGPVDGLGLRRLMPDQPGLRKLVDLVRAYAGPDLGFDVQVILRADCVPDLMMPAAGEPEGDVSKGGLSRADLSKGGLYQGHLSKGGLSQADAPRLGWNTWAKSLPALSDKDDIILDPDLVMAGQGGKMMRNQSVGAVLELT